MTETIAFEDRIAEQLRAYAAPAARPPRREAVANAVEAARNVRGDVRGGLRWRRLGRPSLTFAAGAAAVVLAVVGVVFLRGVPSQPGVGGPTATQTSAPTVTPTPTPDPRSSSPTAQPIVLSYASGDGEVTASAPSTWRSYWPGSGADDLDVSFGLLWQGPGSWDSSEHIGLVDPVAYDAWCAANGGSPLLSAPAGADAIAQQIVADPNFETSAPAAARIGGIDAVSIDVALAPGGEACEVQKIEISRWIHVLATQPGTRLHLYLVDLPEGMSVETLAITVVAPEERFEEFIDETAPIIESIEFHPRVGTNSPSEVP